MQELQVPMVDSFHCIYDSDGENEWGWQVALKGWVPGTVKGERVRSLIGCGRVGERECEAEACSRVTDAHAVLMANGKAVTRRRFNSLCFNAFCRTGR